MSDNGRCARLPGQPDYPPILPLVSCEPGEVGEPVDIVTPGGTIRATWLGTVGAGGYTLTEAVALMTALERERREVAIETS